MSLISEIPTAIYYIAFMSLSSLALIFALLIFKSKSLVYNAYMLAGIGISVAGLIAMMGFQIVAAVQVIVYIGASVLFFIVSLSMMGDLKVQRENLLTSLFAGILSAIAIFIAITKVEATIPYVPTPTLLSLSTFSSYLVDNYVIALVILSVSVIFISLAGIYVSKRITREEDKNT